MHLSTILFTTAELKGGFGRKVAPKIQMVLNIEHKVTGSLRLEKTSKVIKSNVIEHHVKLDCGTECRSSYFLNKSRGEDYHLCENHSNT